MALPERQQHRLRLVGSDSAESLATWSAARAVAEENKAAARMTNMEASDPRWLLALQTAAQLEGDRLSPEARQRLERTAKLLGVRAFDANIIMAIVQDHARRNKPVAATSSLLKLVDVSGPERDRAALRWMAAIALAGVGLIVMIRWIIGG